MPGIYDVTNVGASRVTCQFRHNDSKIKAVERQSNKKLNELERFSFLWNWTVAVGGEMNYNKDFVSLSCYRREISWSPVQTDAALWANNSQQFPDVTFCIRLHNL